MSNPGRVRPVWVSDKLFPFKSRFIEIGWNTVHYIDEGEGPLLLFLHGNPTWSFLYRNIIKELKSDYRCVALDYPGFGLSHPHSGYDFRPSSHSRLLQMFISELGLKNINMMMQDWGGPIGLNAATLMPEKFSSFIIGNTFAWPLNNHLSMQLFSRTVGGDIGRLAIENFNFFVNVILPFASFKTRFNADMMLHYRAPFKDAESRIPTHVFPRELLGSYDFLNTLCNRLSTIAGKRTLFLWGNRDPAFDTLFLTQFKNIFSNHRTRILQGAGHYIQEDAHAEICSEIRNSIPVQTETTV